MEFFYKELRKIKVAYKETKTLGVLGDVLLNPDTGIVLAYCLKKTNKKWFSVLDILSYERDLISINQNTRFHNIVHFDPNGTICHKGGIINKKVYTEDGFFIGTVKDFIIDTNINYLKCLYVVKSFLIFFAVNTSEIPFSSIIEIQKKKIIVKNLFKMQKNLELKNLIPALD